MYDPKLLVWLFKPWFWKCMKKKCSCKLCIFSNDEHQNSHQLMIIIFSTCCLYTKNIAGHILFTYTIIWNLNYIWIWIWNFTIIYIHGTLFKIYFLNVNFENECKILLKKKKILMSKNILCIIIWWWVLLILYVYFISKQPR